MPQAKIARLLIEAETTQVSKAERDLQKLGKTARTTTGETGKLGRGFDKTGKEAAQLSRQANKTSQALKGINTNGLLATATLTALGYALYRSGQAASQANLQTTKLVAEVNTLLDGTQRSFDIIIEGARELVSTYGGDINNQIRAIYDSISSGAPNAASAIEEVALANRSAIVGATDANTALGLIAPVLNAYGRENLDAAYAVDLFQLAVNEGKINIPQLSSVLGRATPIAAAFGVNLENVLGSVVALTKGGISGAESITGLRGILVAISQPAKAATQAAKELGIEFSAGALAKENGFANIIGELREALQGLDADTKAIRIKELFPNQEGQVAALSLLGEGYATLRDFIGKTETALGSVDMKFSQVEETISQRHAVALGKLQASQDIFGESLNQRLIPAIETYANFVGYTADNMDKLAIVGGAVAGVVIPAIGASLLRILPTITLATGGLNLLGAALGALAVGGYLLYTSEAEAATDDLGEAVARLKTAQEEANETAKTFASEGTAQAGKAALKAANELQAEAKAVRQVQLAELELELDRAKRLANPLGRVLTGDEDNSVSQARNQLFDNAQTRISEIGIIVDDLSDKIEEGEKDVANYGKALQVIATDTDKTTQSTDELTENQSELNDVWQAGLSLQDNFSKGMRKQIDDTLELAKATNELTESRLRGASGFINLGTGIVNGTSSPEQTIGQLDGLFAQGGAAESLFGANSAFVGAIQGVLPVAGLAVAAFGALKAIGGGVKQTGSGLELNIDDDVNGNLFRTTTATGGQRLARVLNNGSPNRIHRDDLTAEQNADLNRLFSPLIQRAMDFEEAFSESFTAVSVKGKDANEVINQYNNAITAQIDGLQKYIQAGETGVETATALANATQVLNGALTFAGFGGQFDKNIDDAGNARLFQQRLTANGETGNFAILNNSRSLEEQLLIEQRGLIRELEQNGGLSLQGKTLEEVRNAIQGLDPSNGVFQAGVSAVDNIKRIEELTDAITRRDTGGGGSFSSGQIDNNRFASLAEQRIAEGIAANALGETKQDTTNRLLKNLIDATISGDNKQLDLANKQLILAVKSG